MHTWFWAPLFHGPRAVALPAPPWAGPVSRLQLTSSWTLVLQHIHLQHCYLFWIADWSVCFMIGIVSANYFVHHLFIWIDVRFVLSMLAFVSKLNLGRFLYSISLIKIYFDLYMDLLEWLMICRWMIQVLILLSASSYYWMQRTKLKTLHCLSTHLEVP